MRVVVKSREINLNLYIPMFVLTSGIRLTKFINKNYNKNDSSDKSIQNAMKYLDYIDMNIIMSAIKELKNYKGLTLVEVRDKDGTYVLIKTWKGAA